MLMYQMGSTGPTGHTSNLMRRYQRRQRRMLRRKLREHKFEKKTLAIPLVSFGKGHRLPPPLHEVVRAKNRTETTKLIPVSRRHYVCFLWRNGPVRIKSAFYGWLLHVTKPNEFKALAALHYHPSHKPAHLVMPCDKPEDEDLQALGKGCSELNIDASSYDP